MDPTQLTLARAVTAADVEGVKAALAAGGDARGTDEEGVPLLILAAREGHSEVARLLLAAGADPRVERYRLTPRIGWHRVTGTASRAPPGLAPLDELGGTASRRLLTNWVAPRHGARGGPCRTW